jgi:hypothetical protein
MYFLWVVPEVGLFMFTLMSDGRGGLGCLIELIAPRRYVTVIPLHRSRSLNPSMLNKETS